MARPGVREAADGESAAAGLRPVVVGGVLHDEGGRGRRSPFSARAARTVSRTSESNLRVSDTMPSFTV